MEGVAGSLNEGWIGLRSVSAMFFQTGVRHFFDFGRKLLLSVCSNQMWEKRGDTAGLSVRLESLGHRLWRVVTDGDILLN
jgi:hypothetical protein